MVAEFLFLLLSLGSIYAERNGIPLGSLYKEGLHGVRGDVFVVNENTFYIRNFSYDGKAPNVSFWAGRGGDEPSAKGFTVPDELKTLSRLGEYRNKDIIISLPSEVKISDIRWLSVWCRQANVDFGHVIIPRDINLPKPLRLSPLRSRAHKVKSDDIILNDSKTMTIYQLYYDGAGPDAFFLVGNGTPDSRGTKVPDENGRTGKLNGYRGKDVTIRLPGSLTWFDVEWFALYCIAFQENFGEVFIPKDPNIPIDLSQIQIHESIPLLDNCVEIFQNKFIVRWKVVNNDIYIQLEGRASIDEYLAFGISGHPDKAQMESADVAVAFYNKMKSSVEVVDYYLSSKAQCSVNDGACPDVRIGGQQNIFTLDGSHKDNLLQATYKRRLEATEDRDKTIHLNTVMSMVAAIGPINSRQETAIHTVVTKKPIRIDFSLKRNECNSLGPSSEPTSTPKPWTQPKISGETLFRAQIGPHGGKRGYEAFTGITGWGYAWWINGYLIPELTVERGVTYSFIVEGGDNNLTSTHYHPFYITNNKEGGGYQYKEKLWKPDHMVYAGLIRDEAGNVIPVAVGRFCEYQHKTIDESLTSETFEKFKNTLELHCKDGHPGGFTWIPDDNTPDTVYYQCFTHRNFGWKINVIGKQCSGNEGLLKFWNWLFIYSFCYIIKLNI